MHHHDDMYGGRQQQFVRGRPTGGTPSTNERSSFFRKKKRAQGRESNLSRSQSQLMWETVVVKINRVSGMGFGIAVSGGRDNPHYMTEEDAIVISDVLAKGPAEHLVKVNDRVLAVNNKSMEGVEHEEAIMALRDSGNTVTLHIKRPIVEGGGLTGVDGSSNVQSIELLKERTGYGMKLAIKLFIEDMNPEGSAAKSGLTSGDNIVAINGMPIEAMSLPDAKKIIQNSRGSLMLDIKKEPKKKVEEKTTTPARPKKADTAEEVNGLPESPNLMSPLPPGMDSDTEVDVVEYVEDTSLPAPPDDTRSFEEIEDGPPRPQMSSNPDLPGIDSDDPHSILPPFSEPVLSTPPPPGHDDPYEDEPPQNRGYRQPSYEPPSVTPGSEERHVSFIKGKSIGLQLVGGNSTGIFVAAMQPGSAAEKAGVHEGDQILQVNDSSLLGMTKEDAVLMLLSLTNEIRLVCRYDKRMCDEVMKSGKGDDFYVRTHFSYESQGNEEMTFFKNNIFRVIDTMYEGMVGWWYALKIGDDEREEARGIIPNNSRAEQIASSQPPDFYMKPQSTTTGRGSFFKRRGQKSFRSTKTLIKDEWDRVVFGGTPPKFPAYERVALKDPEFIRPVVLFGPLADIARDKLLAEFTEKFESPYNQGEGESQGTIKVHAIREIMGKGKHCILDITPNAVERLNFAQFYPIVVFLRPDKRQTVKHLRGKHLEPDQNRGSNKLTQTAKKLNKVFVHIFSATVRLGPDVPWFSLTRDAILKEQNKPIWMSDVSVPKDEQEPELPVVGELRLPVDYDTDAESAMSGAESAYDDSMVDSDYEADKVPSPKLNFRPSNDYTLPNSFTDDYRSPREPRSKHKSNKPYSPDTDEEYGGDLSDGSTGYTPQNKPSPNRRRPNEASRRRKEEREREDRDREEEDRRDREEIERRERERMERDIQNKKKREQLEKERERERELIKEIERQQEDRRREAEIKMSISTPSFDEPTIMDPVSITPSYTHQSYSSPSSNARTFDVHVEMPAPPVDSPVTSSSYNLPPKPAPKPRYDPTQFTSSTLMDYTKPEVKPRPAKLTTDSRDMPELVKVEAVVHPSKAQAVHTSFAQPAQAMETTFGAEDDYIQPTHVPEERSSPYWQPAKETDLDSYVTATPAETTFDANDEPSYNGVNGSSYKSDNNNKYGSSKPDPASPYYDPKMEPVNAGISFNREKDHRIDSYKRLTEGPFGHESSRGRPPKSDFDGFNRVLDPKPPYEKQSYKAYREQQTRGRDQSPGSSYLKSSLYTPAAWGSNRQSNDHLRTEHTFKSVKAPQGKGSQDNLDKADNGETPVDQMDGQTVLATAKGIFDHRGGTLTSEETGVSIVIPEYALPYGVQQEIYFKVCRDNSMLPPLDSYKGETLLSPLVMCGPHNLKFNKPVELRLPHQTSMTPDGWSFNLKSSDTPAGQPAKWKNLKIDDDEHRSQKTVVGTKTVSVMVDHF